MPDEPTPRPARFLAILGPTASGKSGLSLALAERLGGELVCCDSQQVYVGMDVGTAKPTPAERQRVPHHGLDLVTPEQPFHAARWAEVARAAIDAITARGRLPIVVGGTGLYYRALTAGLFEAPPSDPAIRARHRDQATRDGVAALHAQLAAIDPEAAASIRTGDLVRISRALEIHEQTGVPISILRRQAAPPRDLAPTVILLDPPLDELRVRIATRVADMLVAGFLDEVRTLRAAGYGPALKPLQALGYRQLGQVLDGVLSLADATAQTIQATVQYARRQRTWFRSEAAALRLGAAPDIEPVLSVVGAGVK